MKRFGVYFNERFPLLRNGLLIAAFSSCAIAFSSLLPPVSPLPSWKCFLVAFISCFGFFLQLRIADEFKDANEDRAFRPYRPVPRGLVKLSELRNLFIGLAVLQVLLALWLQPKLLFLLMITWAYLALMSVEFFARNWLKSRPITYLWTHMLIMPLVDLYATACQWMTMRPDIPSGLGWFLFLSFTNGLVIEVGRKIRMPEKEEPGVPTYSKIWGRKMAAFAWFCLIVVTDLVALIASHRTGYWWLAAVLLPVPVFFAMKQTHRFLFNEKLPGNAGGRFELWSGIWTIFLYLTLGLLSLIIHEFS